MILAPTRSALLELAKITTDLFKFYELKCLFAYKLNIFIFNYYNFIINLII